MIGFIGFFDTVFTPAFSSTDFRLSFFFGRPDLLGALQAGQYITFGLAIPSSRIVSIDKLHAARTSFGN
jgi:hypothetical protein